MKTKLAILSLTDALGFAGGEARILSFAKTIDKNSFTHRVVCVRALNPDLAPEDAAMRNQFVAAGIPVADLGGGYTNTNSLKLLRAPGALIRSVEKLCKLIRKYKVDLIDAHQPAASLVAVLSAKRTRIRAAVTGYEAAIWDGNLTLQSRIGSIPALGRRQIAFGLADVIITDSHERSDEIRRSLWRKNPRMSVIPNGVAPPLPTRSAEEVKHSIGLPCDPAIKVVGQVGRLVPFKGYMQLLESARLVLNRRLDVFFLIVGHVREPEYKLTLERKAAALGIDDRVKIISYTGPIGDVWRVIDIHAHASLFDSLPNSIIESMSLAKPAVVTCVGGIPSMVQDGVTGLLVPPNDPLALSSGLLRLLSDKSYAERLGQAANKRYLARYTAELMSRNLERLFRDMCIHPRSVKVS